MCIQIDQHLYYHNYSSLIFIDDLELVHVRLFMLIILFTFVKDLPVFVLSYANF